MIKKGIFCVFYRILVILQVNAAGGGVHYSTVSEGLKNMFHSFQDVVGNEYDPQMLEDFERNLQENAASFKSNFNLLDEATNTLCEHFDDIFIRKNYYYPRDSNKRNNITNAIDEYFKLFNDNFTACPGHAKLQAIRDNAIAADKPRPKEDQGEEVEEYQDLSSFQWN